MARAPSDQTTSPQPVVSSPMLRIHSPPRTIQSAAGRPDLFMPQPCPPWRRCAVRPRRSCGQARSAAQGAVVFQPPRWRRGIVGVGGRASSNESMRRRRQTWWRDSGQLAKNARNQHRDVWRLRRFGGSARPKGTGHLKHLCRRLGGWKTTAPWASPRDTTSGVATSQPLDHAHTRT